MRQLQDITDDFIDRYIYNHRNHLGRTSVGGTDWRFADIVAPAFKEILEIARPVSVLEIGFNMGGSALMFLSINNVLFYHSVDIVENPKSVEYLQKNFPRFMFFNEDSKGILPAKGMFFQHYNMVFIDGDHSPEGVVGDIESAIRFKPYYILFDDVKHPSHSYIENLILNEYKDKLQIVKMFEFNQCWQGYSFALCKVIV